MNFIKKHMSILIPAGIGILALALFVPTVLMSGSLKEEIKSESISMADQISSLESKVVSKNQYEIEQQYQDSQIEDANTISTLAKQTSQRELLSYKIFPRPIDTSPQLFSEFGDRFKKHLDRLVREKINALDCPSDREILKSAGSGSSTSAPKKSGFSAGGGGMAMPMGMGGSRQPSRSKGGVNDAITDIICNQRAESISVYGNPADLGCYDFWTDYEYIGIDGATADCWYSQLAVWIIEDVVDTIAKVNTGSENVLTAPVKRLLSIRFQEGDESSGTELPGYVRQDGQGMATAWTKRINSDEIEIMHFKVKVITNAKSVSPFMKELCSGKEHSFKGFKGTEPEQKFSHNQITILDAATRPVIRSEPEHELYRYGENATVEIELACEYAFNREGYYEIKPEVLKKLDEPEESERDLRKNSRSSKKGK